jgi:hypothetical protein
MPIDAGIVRAVRLLNEAGIVTDESCEGGQGHSFPEPTVRFHGSQDEGWRALSVMLAWNLPVRALRREWAITNEGPDGPYWDLVFRRKLF